jgi:4-amino-4-deoxy-L-arabinose transferase-like glycosyltransferase
MGIVDGRRWILAAAIVGLVARLCFSFLYWTDKPLTHDEREYLALASSLQAGHGFTYPADHEVGTSQRFGRAPGYPAFLAAIGVGNVHQSTPARVKIVQAVLGALVVWMIGAIARRASGERAGLIAAGISAIYPPLVWTSAYVFSEALYMPLALGCVMLLAAARRHALLEGSARAGGATTLLAGLLAGLAMLVRSGMLVFLPFAALWFITRRQWSLAAAFCVAAAVVVAPWTLRNAREHGRFMLVASDGGVTFWTGNHPLARGEGDLAANPDLKRAEIEFRQAHPGLTAEQLEPLYYRDAVNRILERPGWWTGLVFKKLFYTFVPVGPSYTLHSTKYLLATVIPYSVLLPFAVAGLTRLLRRENAATPLLLLAGSVVLTGLIFFPQERFRIPVLDPTVIVSAAIVLARAQVRS